jgi:hemerythrin-like domain-containing protein
VRSHTDALNAALDDLQAEHVLSARMNAYLHAAFVHYQGGAPHGFQRFKNAVDAYAGMLADHMRKEEELFSRAREHLTEGDWQNIAAAFEANSDPLAEPREEFRRLYMRIVNQLPRKMRLPPHRHEQ